MAGYVVVTPLVMVGLIAESFQVMVGSTLLLSVSLCQALKLGEYCRGLQYLVSVTMGGGQIIQCKCHKGYV